MVLCSSISCVVVDTLRDLLRNISVSSSSSLTCRSKRCLCLFSWLIDPFNSSTSALNCTIHCHVTCVHHRRQDSQFSSPVLTPLMTCAMCCSVQPLPLWSTTPTGIRWYSNTNSPSSSSFSLNRRVNSLFCDRYSVSLRGRGNQPHPQEHHSSLVSDQGNLILTLAIHTAGCLQLLVLLSNGLLQLGLLLLPQVALTLESATALLQCSHTRGETCFNGGSADRTI